jgi:hypothetical protein
MCIKSSDTINKELQENYTNIQGEKKLEIHTLMYIWLIFDKQLMRIHKYKKYQNINEILKKYIFHLGNYITENDSLRVNLIVYYNQLPDHLKTVPDHLKTDSSERLKNLYEKAKAASQEKAKVLPKNTLINPSSQKSIKRGKKNPESRKPTTSKKLTQQGGKRKYKMSRKNKKIQKKNITIKKRR